MTASLNVKILPIPKLNIFRKNKNLLKELKAGRTTRIPPLAAAVAAASAQAAGERGPAGGAAPPRRPLLRLGSEGRTDSLCRKPRMLSVVVTSTSLQC